MRVSRTHESRGILSNEPFHFIDQTKSGVLADRRFYPGERGLVPGTIRGCLPLQRLARLPFENQPPSHSMAFIRSLLLLLLFLLLLFFLLFLLVLSGPDATRNR